ncbi:MAG: nuclear transport factor 2 family protein [Actinomycetota bacterium]
METLSIDVQTLRRPSWSAEETANAELVATFVHLLMNEHDFASVRDRFRASAYRQHNHAIRDGIDGVIDTVSGLVKRFPEYGYDVKHILADDDVVIFHSHATLRAKHRGDDRRGFNITDRWRLDGGEIVEHWDSIQPMDRFARSYVLLTGGRVRNTNGTY